MTPKPRSSRQAAPKAKAIRRKPSKRTGRKPSPEYACPRECADCGEERQITGRNLCRECYEEHRSEGTLDQYEFGVWGKASIVCKLCGKKADNAGYGLCNNCYFLNRPPKMVKCGGCGKRKPHRAMGLCNPCYMRSHKPRVIDCPGCKRRIPIHARGLCIRCSRRWQAGTL